MGKLSPFINAWACLWTLFVSIIFILPTTMPTSADTMNYAAAFLVAILAFAAIYWYAYGRRVYTGPLVETAGFNGDHSRDSSEGSDGKLDVEKPAPFA